MAAEDSVHAPLLACSESSDLQRARSACVLHDECFLSVGKAKSSEASDRVQRKLWIATSLALAFMIVEVIGGYLASSVAIMSDAAHMLSDVSAFLVAIFAAWAATQRSTWHYSFGYHRIEILGALISVLIIWMLSGALVVEAVQRVINPVRVDGKLMFIIASGGIVFNIVMVLALGVHAHHGHSHGECGGHGHSHSHSESHSHGAGCSHGHSAAGSSSSKHKKQQQQQNGSQKRGHGHAGACDGHGHSHSHSHSHSHADVEAGQGGCSGHGHAHSHDHSHDHEHDHSSSSSDSGSEHGGSGHSHQHQHGSGGCQGHGHDPSHHHHDPQQNGGGPAHAEQQQQAAGTGEAVVVDMGAAVAAATPEAAGGSRTSIDIEVRCAAPAMAKQGQSSSHSHSHGHDHDADEDDDHHHHGHDHHGHDHHAHDHDNINLRGAVLHVIGDLVQSMGVALAGALIWYNQDDPRWYIADPICTFVFSILVLLTTSHVLRDIIQVLMERTPRSMDVPELMEAMREVEGIEDVHDLHVWNISTGIPVLTAHVHVANAADHSSILLQLERSFQRRGIKHSTVQICNPVPAAQV